MAGTRGRRSDSGCNVGRPRSVACKPSLLRKQSNEEGKLAAEPVHQPASATLRCVVHALNGVCVGRVAGKISAINALFMQDAKDAA